MQLKSFARTVSFALLTCALNAQALSGTYVVGPGGSYPNIAAAGAALVANGVAGPVLFQVVANDVGPWTLPAFPGQGAANPVVFDGGGTTTISAAGTNVLTLNGCSHVTFNGFISNPPSPTTLETVLILGSTTSCAIKNCTILTTASTTGSYTVVRFTGGVDCRIEDSHIGGGYSAFTVTAGATGTIIQRNRILGGGFRLADIGGPNSTFRNNFAYGASNFGLNCGIPGNLTVAVNLKVHNNSFYVVHPISSSQYCAIRWYTNQGLGTEFVNNVVYDAHPSTANGYAMWCSGAAKPDVSNNNVWFMVNGLSLISSAGNLTLANWQALGFDLASQQSDPFYLNVAASPPDLRLISGSPAVGAGATIATVTDDLFGSPRSAPYDVGAHEFSSFNLLTFTTTGGGTGDLNYALDLPAPAAVEGLLLVTANATNPLGVGPAFGIWPDAMTWDLLVNPSPLFAGNPLHFVIGVPGVFPSVPFYVSPGILSFLGGQTWDAVVLTFGPGVVFTGASNVQRAAF